MVIPVATGLHQQNCYNFLIPGHTKFAPEWCFGLLKQMTRKTSVSSLFDIAAAAEASASVNIAEFVGLHNGTVHVLTRSCHKFRVTITLDLIKIFLELCFANNTGPRKKQLLIS